MHIFGVFLLFIVLTHSAYTSFSVVFKATKEQHVPVTTKPLSDCTVELIYDHTITDLTVDVDCTTTGLGSPILAAHIHQIKPGQDLVHGSGDPIISLVTTPPTDPNAFKVNQTSNIDFICNDEAYLNIHTAGEEYNVRADFIGMESLCNLGESGVPTGTTVKSWGPAPAEGEMQPWAVHVDIVDSTDPNIKCPTRITYKPGFLYISGWCEGTTENIKFINVHDTKDNTTVLKFFEDTTASPAFSALIPFSFKQTLSNSDRDELCTNTATASTWNVVIETDTLEITGKIVLDMCPAVGTAPPTVPSAPSGAHTFSVTVYLTVFLALFSKWLL